jgi:hypothetical protein
MEKYPMGKVKSICERIGLKPARVIGTKDGVQFTKGKSNKVEVISFDEFEEILNRKGLAVYGYITFMKIMKDQGPSTK